MLLSCIADRVRASITQSEGPGMTRAMRGGRVSAIAACAATASTKQATMESWLVRIEAQSSGRGPARKLTAREDKLLLEPRYRRDLPAGCPRWESSSAPHRSACISTPDDARR